MSATTDSRYYVVREDVLPEAMLKTLQVKELLIRGEVSTIHDAVEQVGLSRSAFYKYKDGIHPYTKRDTDRFITLSMQLQHRAGILSKVLSTLASYDGNVLTIHQTIPIQGKAHVVISLEISMLHVNQNRLVDFILQIEGVSRVVIIGQSET